MNRNRMVKKAAVVGLSMALTASQVFAGIPCNVKAAEVSKQESVFVNLDANGKKTDITVTDWIKNVTAASSLNDSSDLKDIYNVKGEESFTQKGSNLIWAAKSADIYYQGKINKELPVTMHITYRLDGKEVTPDELKGKSGKLEMKIEYENHAKETVTVDGKDLEVNVPFAMITGVILPTDHFKNVEIDNGKIMSDADKNIVVGVAMPGLKESLDLSEKMAKDIEIPSSLVITADTTDFEMGATFTLATSEILNDVEADKIESVNELKDSMNDLKDASGKLVDGSEDLAKGMKTLKDKSNDFTNGIGTLTNGLGQLSSGAQTLESGVKSYTNGADQLAAGIKKLGTAIKELPEKLKELSGGISSAKGGADQLVDSTGKLEQGMQSVNGGIDTVNTTLSQVSGLLSQIEGADENLQIQTAIQTINALVETTGENGSLKTGAAAVETGLGQLKKGEESLQSGLGTIQEGVSALAGSKDTTQSLTSALTQLSVGADQLSQNSQSLVKGAEGIRAAAVKLQEGGNQLNSGSDALKSGINELNDGSVKLRDGMKEFDEDGIMKLYNMVNNDLDAMFNRLEAISKAGKNYKSFAGINEDMEGCVRFIMETDEIK